MAWPMGVRWRAVAWVDAERYRYRRTVEGGFAFVVRRVGDAQAQPVFAQVALHHGRVHHSYAGARLAPI